MELKLNAKEISFLKKYCPEWIYFTEGKNNLRENIPESISNKELEDLFWDEIRWLIVVEDPVMKKLDDNEFVVLIKLFDKAGCVKDAGDEIAASGLLNRLKEEGENRGIEFEGKGIKLKDLELIKIYTQEEIDEMVFEKNNIFHRMTTILEEYELSHNYESMIRFIIPSKIVDMLSNTKCPIKYDLMKLPFDNIYLEFDFLSSKAKFPYGLILYRNDEDDGYTIKIPYIKICKNPQDEIIEVLKISSESDEDYFIPKRDNWYESEVYTQDNINAFNDSDGDYDSFYSHVDDNQIKELNLKKVLDFIGNYLLFINDPRVSYRHVKKQKPKDYKMKEYIFKEPKTAEVILDGILKKIVDDYYRQKTGVKMKYEYQFPVRGHFRRLMNKKYVKPHTIWIPPYYKGNKKGKKIKKDYISE